MFWGSTMKNSRWKKSTKVYFLHKLKKKLFGYIGIDDVETFILLMYRKTMTYTMLFRIVLHYYTYMNDESLLNHQFTWWMEILPRKLDGFVSIKMSKTIIWIW